MKKVLKVLGITLLIIIVLLAGWVIWNWEMFNIIMNDAKVDQTQEIPVHSQRTDLPKISQGEADWLGWRGKTLKGRSLVLGITTHWSEGLPKNWEVNYLCKGSRSAVWSSPVIQGNRLIACGRNETEDQVFCLSPDTGELIWNQSYPSEAGSSYGAGFRATPCIDSNLVYTFGRGGDLVCWNLFDGKQLWRQNVNDHGGEEPTWGHSTSPLIYQNAIFVNGGGTARILAFEKKTGTLLWKSGTGVAGYAGINSFELEGSTFILSFHGKGLAAHTPSDGKEVWNVEWNTDYDVNATTPIISDNKIFMTSGYQTGSQLLAVDAGSYRVQWSQKEFAAHHSDPIILDGYLYGYSGNSMQNKGQFMCLDLETGIIQWTTSEMGMGTMVYVDGYLLCCDIKGNLFLTKPNPKSFELVTKMPHAIADVNDASWTVPVVANGRLFLRYKQTLSCWQLTSN